MHQFMQGVITPYFLVYDNESSIIMFPIFRKYPSAEELALSGYFYFRYLKIS